MDRVLNFKKGDKCIVAIEEHSNASRHKDMSIDNINDWTYEGVVIASGKKYITVEFNNETSKFEVDNDYRKKVNYGSNDYKLFKDIQGVKDERELDSLIWSIRMCFDRMNKSNTKLTLDQLRRISNIISE